MKSKEKPRKTNEKNTENKRKNSCFELFRVALAGRLTPVLHRVPLYIVNSDDMGQRGAHLRAVQLLKSEAWLF